jgi:hypothetical protein
MRPSFLSLGLFLGAACTFPGGAYDTGVSSPHSVSWAGYVLDGPYNGENDVLTGGDFEVDGLESDFVAQGTEKDPEGSPGYWSVRVPPDTPVALRISADGMLPTLWEAVTPEHEGLWSTGALFAFRETTWLPIFQQYDGIFRLTVGDLDAEHSWLFGLPLSPDDWVDAEISVVDGAGVDGRVVALADDGEGALMIANGRPVVEFLAFNLAPGSIEIHVVAADGRTLDLVFPARGGEILTPWFLALPEAR